MQKLPAQTQTQQTPLFSPTSIPTSLQLTLLSSQLSAPIQLTASTSSSILALKQALLLKYGWPLDKQKLIYAGRVLSDDRIVASILATSAFFDDKPSFHLVLTPDILPQKNESSIKETTETIPQQQLLPQQPFQVVMLNGLPYALMSIPSPLLNTPTLSPPIYHVQQPIPEPPPQPVPQPPQVDDEFPEFQQQPQPPNTLLLMFKLSFLVYIFSQNASWARICVLYITALIIFLVQTRWIGWNFGRRVTRREQADGHTQQEVVEDNIGWRSTLRIIGNGVWNFISSVIPENPEI